MLIVSTVLFASRVLGLNSVLRQVLTVIPEWILFSFAMVAAIGAIVVAIYVMKLFRAGHVKIIWPLKILRFMVASIVTAFFTTVDFGCVMHERRSTTAVHANLVVHRRFWSS